MKYLIILLCLLSNVSYALADNESSDSLSDMDIKNNRYIYCEGISNISKNIMFYRQNNVKERDLLSSLSIYDINGTNSAIEKIIILAYKTPVSRYERKSAEMIDVFRKRVFVDCVLTDNYLIK